MFWIFSKKKERAVPAEASRRYDFSRYEHAADPPGADLVNAVAAGMRMQGIGPELSGYLSNYGYLAHGSIELYGVTARQGLDSV